MGFDATLYGQLLYALRHMRGYRKAADLADAITAMGVPTREHTIWAIERGDQEAKVSRHLAFVKLLRPSDGYFEQTLVVADGSE